MLKKKKKRKKWQSHLLQHLIRIYSCQTELLFLCRGVLCSAQLQDVLFNIAAIWSWKQQGLIQTTLRLNGETLKACRPSFRVVNIWGEQTQLLYLEKPQNGKLKKDQSSCCDSNIFYLPSETLSVGGLWADGAVPLSCCFFICLMCKICGYGTQAAVSLCAYQPPCWWELAARQQNEELN